MLKQLYGVGMTYRDRQQLRKAKIVSSKRKRDVASAEIYWLTLVRKNTTCCKCAGVLIKNRKMVYCAKRKECICLFCSEKESLKYELSFSYEMNIRKERSRRH